MSFREVVVQPFLNKVTERLSGTKPLSRSVIGSEARNLLPRQTAKVQNPAKNFETIFFAVGCETFNFFKIWTSPPQPQIYYSKNFIILATSAWFFWLHEFFSSVCKVFQFLLYQLLKLLFAWQY